MVSGNRELIGQAISNLIENAIKYSTGGGGESTIRISLEQHKGEKILCVRDSGPGIPANRREDVVKRFVRLDESRSKPGTGLGLSLVDAIMGLHGGRLELASSDEIKQSGLCARMVFG